MKKLLLVGIVTAFAISSVSAASITVCASCHGASFEKKL